MINSLLENDLEILIATKDRENLDFLMQMFPFKHFSNYNILIINQTESNVLITDYPSVRVVNTIEKGLSKSRNMAIRNAIKSICLLADDDVVYYPDFEKEIISTFTKWDKASIITFNHLRIGLTKPQNPSLKFYKHTRKSIWNVSSIEIAFKLKDIKEKEIYFDEHFGLGSFFETGEEFLFMKKALMMNIKSYFSPSIIVSHPLFSSGKNEGNDELLYARSALFYKLRGHLVYLWLVKYVFFLVRNRYIKRSEFIEKYEKGLSGINKYIELTKLK